MYSTVPSFIQEGTSVPGIVKKGTAQQSHALPIRHSTVKSQWKVLQQDVDQYIKFASYDLIVDVQIFIFHFKYFFCFFLEIKLCKPYLLIKITWYDWKLQNSY